MKRFSFLGVMALLCAVACQQEPERIPDNPNYNPETKEVTAQFVMNVSTNSANAETRMTAEDVQTPGTAFRGMDKVHILTYNLDYTAQSGDHFIFNDGSVSGSWPASAVGTRDYDLAKVLVANEISENQSSKVLEMSLPLQTNAVLIYGRAPKSKTSTTDDGSVTAAGDLISKFPSNLTFSLDSRLSDTEYAAFNQFTDLISRILTGILRSGLRQETAGQGSAVTADNRYKFWWPIDDTSKLLSLTDDSGAYWPDGKLDQTGQYTFHIGTATWRGYSLAYDEYKKNPTEENKMSSLEIRLGDMYQQITTIKTNGVADSEPDYQVELRAGSAQAIFRLSADVYSLLVDMETANITTWHDYVAMLVAKEIHNRAYAFFYQDPVTQTMTWRPLTGGGSIAAAVDSNVPDRTWATNYNLVTDDFFNRGTSQPGFPMNLGLPAGAALMTFSTVPPQAVPANQYEVVSYLTNIPAYGMGGASVPITSYRYPAELMYWTNSSLRTTDNTVSKESYPVTVTTWDRESSWSGWNTNAPVLSTTRGVAVTKEINYGSAMLKASVKYGADVIYDNNSGIHDGEQDNAIDVKNTANQFKVTGLIIGGVDDVVGWNFLPINNSFSHLVYESLDNQAFYIPTGKATSNAVYTLTWDNYDSGQAADKQNPVYIALELYNDTGKDLWGGLNLIRKGGTFYLVGKLDPQDETSLTRLKAKFKDAQGNLDLTRKNFNYPPFDANGKTISAARVFMQDFVTEVVFSFNAHSLRNAYVTMPDLRASNVSLGLSVDLSWEDGLYFENVPLGGVTD